MLLIACLLLSLHEQSVRVAAGREGFGYSPLVVRVAEAASRLGPDGETLSCDCLCGALRLAGWEGDQDIMQGCCGWISISS